MEVEIPRDISENIEKASQQLGLSQKEVVSRALALYLRNLKQYIELQEELEGWEQISEDDSVIFFEKYSL